MAQKISFPIITFFVLVCFYSGCSVTNPGVPATLYPDSLGRGSIQEVFFFGDSLVRAKGDDDDNPYDTTVVRNNTGRGGFNTGPDPVYPVEAAEKGLEGWAIVKAYVTRLGLVKRAFILQSSDSIFNRSALEAAVQSSFVPANNMGIPIDIWVTLAYEFRKEKAETPVRRIR